MENITFKLTNPIKYITKEGDSSESSALFLYSPPASMKRVPIKLRGYFTKAMKRAASSDLAKLEGAPTKDSSDEGMDGDAVVQMLYMMIPEDMEAVHDQFKILIVGSGVVKVQNEVGLTGALYDMITQIELDELLGEYLANFMIASWMGDKPKK